MTTKQTKTEILNNVQPHELAGGYKVRSVKYKGTIHLFLNDLEKIFTAKFKKHLQGDPIKKRVTDGTNSQGRWLITLTQFKNARKVFEEASRLKAAKIRHTKVPSVKPVKSSYTSAPPIRSEVVNATDIQYVLSLDDEIVAKHSIEAVPEKEVSEDNRIMVDLTSVRSFYAAKPELTVKESKPVTLEQIKSNISGQIQNHLIRAFAAEGVVDEKTSAAAHIRQTSYTALYREFDRLYEPYIRAKFGKTLKEVGLGINIGEDAKYLQRLLAFDKLYSENALETMLAVVIKFFAPVE